MNVKLNDTFLLRYITLAPLALAFERSLECQIYSQMEFKRPVLDIGCGDGTFAKILFAEKICAGVDPNERELKLASRYGVYKDLIHCPGNHIPKPDGYYNTIFSNSVLEHIQDVDSVLSEVYRLLAPNGRFYFTAPSDLFDQFTLINQLLTSLGLIQAAARYRSAYNHFWKHYHCYSLDEWREIISGHGFTFLEAYTYNPKELCMLNDFLVPFSILGFFLKKLTNRWTILPPIRKVIYYPISLVISGIIQKGSRSENGGLVFMALTK